MKLIIKIIVVSLLIISCKKEANNSTINESTIIIKYGTYSGWCVGNDSLTISLNNLLYGKYYPCDKVQIFKQSMISSEENNELINSLDSLEFKKLVLNSSNVSFDGTDYWISVKNGSYYHKIRYGAGDTLSIRNIILFVRLLDKQKEKFLNK